LPLCNNCSAASSMFCSVALLRSCFGGVGTSAVYVTYGQAIEDGLTGCG